MVEIKQNLLSPSKYNLKCPYTRTPTRVVIHNTANNGDTARNNCDYYHRVGGMQASAQ